MTRPCETIPSSKPKRKGIKKKKRDRFISLEPGLEKEAAVKAAQNCLGLRDCFSCDLCGLLCPELCITRHESTLQVQIDLEYCKGCGICASVCPKGAIRMELEEGI